MKELRIFFTLLLFSAIAAQGISAQERKKEDKEEVVRKEVFKTTKEKTPVRVKESLNDYSNYKIANEVTYVRKNNVNVYKFRVEKGNWSHYLLISEKGKIMGIETGEH
jgi:hypothetical protein